MLRLMLAGLVAACLQLAIVAFAALAGSTYEWLEAAGRSSVEVDVTSQYDAMLSPSPLIWVFVLSAVGVALTNNRFVRSTTAHIRWASRVAQPTDPGYGANWLQVQLWLVAGGCVILAFQPPPSLLVEVTHYVFGSSSSASTIWSGMMSIATAGFGANARAASQVK